MSYTLSPQECLESIQDSIKSAEKPYSDSNIVWASPKLVTCLNLCLERLFTGMGREDRVETLRILYNRRKGCFHSSKDASMAGALALRSRIYGDIAVDKDTPMNQDTVLGIREAYKLATGQLEFDLVEREKTE